MDIFENYAQLYNYLRETVFNNLLDTIISGDYHPNSRDALVFIVNMPYPVFVSVGQIKEVAEYVLKNISVIDRHRGDNTLGRLVSDINNEFSSNEDIVATYMAMYPRDQFPEDRLNTQLLFDIQAQISKLSTQIDKDLKGECPFCSGPLIEVLGPLDPSNNRELTLRCLNQKTSNCQNYSWLIQSVKES